MNDVSPLPSTSSWLTIPNDSDFSLHNIPFGVASWASSDSSHHRCVTAIGDKVVDLHLIQDAGAFDDIDGLDANVFDQATLNDFMSQSPDVWPQVRRRLLNLFAGTDPLLRDNPALQQAAMHDRSNVSMHLPAKIGDYTDFYSSREHATNVGTMFRGKDNALQPNWLHLPVGYHCRASTVVVSGTEVVRPSGQVQVSNNDGDPAAGSVHGPCRLLDFELEVALFVGGPPNVGPMSMKDAKRRIFGFCLMNDWSARDIQKWEYVPLGPFTSKNFATSISPWIVLADALQPFVAPTSAGSQNDPVPLEYLRDEDYSSYDITLHVSLQASDMETPALICQSNFCNLYWNAAQQLVHHSVTGCTMNPGDLLASGTISGQTPNSFGSMLELSWKGSRTVDLGGGKSRKFLQDGDTVILEGFCVKEGHGRVGFGNCVGKVLPAGSTPPTLAAAHKNTIEGLKLYSYWRSSSTRRVRIALNAKGVSCEYIPINIKLGEHKSEALLQKNAMGQLPVLEYTDTEKGVRKMVTQSVAIIEFLDMAFPAGKALIPSRLEDKIAAMEMVEIINSGIQPLQNTSLVAMSDQSLEGNTFGKDFARGAIVKGLNALEPLIRARQKEHLGQFALGTFGPTIVDIFLIPQLYNASQRFGVDVEKEFPVLAAVDKACASHPWFVSAHASVQMDAEDP